MERCFRLSFLARCLLPSVAKLFREWHRLSLSSTSNSYSDIIVERKMILKRENSLNRRYGYIGTRSTHHSFQQCMCACSQRYTTVYMCVPLPLLYLVPAPPAERWSLPLLSCSWRHCSADTPAVWGGDYRDGNRGGEWLLVPLLVTVKDFNSEIWFIKMSPHWGRFFFFPFWTLSLFHSLVKQHSQSWRRTEGD